MGAQRNLWLHLRAVPQEDIRGQCVPTLDQRGTYEGQDYSPDSEYQPQKAFAGIGSRLSCFSMMFIMFILLFMMCFTAASCVLISAIPGV